MPPVPGPDAEVAAELLRVAGESGKPVLATFRGEAGVPAALRAPGEGPARGSIPSYPAPEEAVRALALAVRHAQWRRQAEGTIPELDGIDVVAAREIVCRAAEEPVEIDATGLLASYGVEVWPGEVVASPEEAVAAAGRLGFPVVVKWDGTGRAGTVRLALSDGARSPGRTPTFESFSGRRPGSRCSGWRPSRPCRRWSPRSRTGISGPW